MRPARILVVDDDPDIHVLLSTMLADMRCQIDSACDGPSGLARLRSAPYDLVLTDVCMPGLDGLELLQRIKSEYPSTPVMVMTAQNTPENVARSLRDHAFTYFSKPFAASTVVDMVTRALESPAAPDDIEVLSARPNWIALRLRCKLEIADRLVQFFRELQVELTAEQIADIAIAFRELLMNAIEHGGRSDPQQEVEVAYIRISHAILYYIRDPGPGFSFGNLPHAAVSASPDDPFRHVEVRSQSGMRPGGFGIFMTREIADELIYNEKGNEVLLVKYLRQQPQS
jgi:CheY-like chemotaxis protein/anti-sigma regulatory factor (Ser/Thr protein kinase)